MCIRDRPAAEGPRPGDGPILQPTNVPSAKSSLRWIFWLVLVVIVAFLSRYLLHSGKRDAAG